MKAFDKIFGKNKSAALKMSSEQQASETIAAKGGYFCPMKCEGEKVYDSPGRCPVCGMFLKPLSDTSKEEKSHPNGGCCGNCSNN